MAGVTGKAYDVSFRNTCGLVSCNNLRKQCFALKDLVYGKLFRVTSMSTSTGMTF